MGKYSLIRFLKNMKFLLTYNLAEREKETQYQTLLYAEDLCRYDVLDPDDPIVIPKILSPEKTLDLILEKPKSFARFGDGEVALIKGESISFQEYDKKLADAMLEILKSDSEDLYVGINYSYFHTSRYMNPFNRKFYMFHIQPARKFLLEHCNLDRTYIAAGFNQMYICSDNIDMESYYAKIKQMFQGRDLVIFAGEGVFDQLDYDLFELASGKEFVWGPNKNSFSQIEELYQKALSYDKSKTFCFVLGPTSKVLVYRLAKLGYLAWDIGHLPKDYDYFRKKYEKSDETVAKFYSSDVSDV